MSSRTRQRVQTGRIGGTAPERARPPPSAHLESPTSTAAKTILQTRSAGSLIERPNVKKPVARMPEVDLSDLTNEFGLIKQVRWVWWSAWLEHTTPRSWTIGAGWSGWTFAAARRAIPLLRFPTRISCLRFASTSTHLHPPFRTTYEGTIDSLLRCSRPTALQRIGIPSSHTQAQAPWLKNAALPPDEPAKTRAELKQKRELQRRPYLHKAVDIDGDGVIDEIEVQLSRLMDTLEGEDLDGDGVITEAEVEATKIAKGKEMLARQFVQMHTNNLRKFWPAFSELDDDQVVRAIAGHPDYRFLMSSLTTKAMQHEMLYDSHRIGDSLRIMATDRDRRWQAKTAQIAENRNKLFQAKFNATVDAQRQGKQAEAQHEAAHFQRKERAFTPLLKSSFMRDAGDAVRHEGGSPLKGK
jgi:hypothetical protein